MAQRILPDVELPSAWTSFVGALSGVLAALGRPVDLATLMGSTGFAFRLDLPERDGVLAAGSGAVAADFARALPLIANTGTAFTLIAAARSDPDWAARREQAISEVRRGIDGGRPAVVFGLQLPEFGIVYGYDDRARSFAVRSMLSGQYGSALPESRWPVRERDDPLIVLIPVAADWRRRLLGRRPAERQGLTDALRFAVAYGHDGDPGDRTGATHGLAAYRRWREALAGATPVDPSGHSHVLQTVQTARRDAATYLRTAVPAGAAAHRLLDAADAYDRAAIALSRLATLFPYPSGGDPNAAGLRGLAINLLSAVEREERAAIGHVEAALSEQR